MIYEYVELNEMLLHNNNFHSIHCLWNLSRFNRVLILFKTFYHLVDIDLDNRGLRIAPK